MREEWLGFVRTLARESHLFPANVDAECLEVEDCVAAPVKVLVTTSDADRAKVRDGIEQLGGVLLNEGIFHFEVPGNALQFVADMPEVLTVSHGFPGLPLRAGFSPFEPPQFLFLGRGSRFRARAWFEVDGVLREGAPIEQAVDSGSFYLFHPGNLEVSVKTLDGCGVNGHHWVFAAGLTDLPVRLELEDTRTAERLEVESTGGPFDPFVDTLAFRCP